MKNRTQFRIIYLKNDQSRKLKDDHPKKYNMVERITHPNHLMPNLVHLSARLQDDVYQDKAMTQRKSAQFYQQENYIAQTLKRKQQNIQKFISQKEQQIKKQKNSIKNLIGSINFAYNKRRQKKISLIKDISKVCSSKSLKNQDDSNNRDLLQADFNTFLNNKQAERTKIMPSIEQIEENKVKKLSIINPEQNNQESANQIVKHYQAKPLNLFHFLSQKTEKQKLTKQIKNRKSSSAISAISSRSKIEKNLFNFQTVLKTEQQQFDWSKLKRNDRNYIAKLQ